MVAGAVQVLDLALETVMVVAEAPAMEVGKVAELVDQVQGVVVDRVGDSMEIVQKSIRMLSHISKNLNSSKQSKDQLR